MKRGKGCRGKRGKEKRHTAMKERIKLGQWLMPGIPVVDSGGKIQYS